MDAYIMANLPKLQIVCIYMEAGDVFLWPIQVSKFAVLQMLLYLCQNRQDELFVKLSSYSLSQIFPDGTIDEESIIKHCKKNLANLNKYYLKNFKLFGDLHIKSVEDIFGINPEFAKWYRKKLGYTTKHEKIQKQIIDNIMLVSNDAVLNFLNVDRILNEKYKEYLFNLEIPDEIILKILNPEDTYTISEIWGYICTYRKNVKNSLLQTMSDDNRERLYQMVSSQDKLASITMERKPMQSKTFVLLSSLEKYNGI